MQLQQDDFMISLQSVRPYFSPEVKSATSQSENITLRSKVAIYKRTKKHLKNEQRNRDAAAN